MSPQELLDRESIRHTMACYNMAGDRLRVAEFLAVFTPDAILESDGAAAADRFRLALSRQPVYHRGVPVPLARRP